MFEKNGQFNQTHMYGFNALYLAYMRSILFFLEVLLDLFYKLENLPESFVKFMRLLVPLLENTQTNFLLNHTKFIPTFTK
jgi:hypothetical protein